MSATIPPHRPGISTQAEAAHSIAPAVPRMRQRALQAIKEAPEGLTRHELAEAIGVSLQSVCGLAKPLLDEGVLVYRPTPGERHPHLTRPTPSGRCGYVMFLAAQEPQPSHQPSLFQP